jgi:hypothetical protein
MSEEAIGRRSFLKCYTCHGTVGQGLLKFE